VVGSALLAQSFTILPTSGHALPRRIMAQCRPEPATRANRREAENRCDAAGVGFRNAHGLGPEAWIPPEMVFASGSGLDPHISPRNAEIQARRVAGARGLDMAKLGELIKRHTGDGNLAFLGEPGVNLLTLNLHSIRSAQAARRAGRQLRVRWMPSFLLHREVAMVSQTAERFSGLLLDLHRQCAGAVVAPGRRPSDRAQRRRDARRATGPPCLSGARDVLATIASFRYTQNRCRTTFDPI